LSQRQSLLTDVETFQCFDVLGVVLAAMAWSLVKAAETELRMNDELPISPLTR
jgi:hypothetical protein